jgi:hypothetical protein
MLETELSSLRAARDEVVAHAVRRDRERDALAADLESQRRTIRAMQSTRAWRLAGRYWRGRARIESGLKRLAGARFAKRKSASG